MLLANLRLVSYAQDAPEPAQTLFQDVRVFNGTENQLLDVDVLVEGNLIKAIGKDIVAREGAAVIDGEGRTLMPGLIDWHVHFDLSMGGGRPGMEAVRWDYMAVMGVAAAQDWFADGFTTVRDMGGMHDGLRRHVSRVSQPSASS